MMVRDWGSGAGVGGLGLQDGGVSRRDETRDDGGRGFEKRWKGYKGQEREETMALSRQWSSL